MAIVAIAAHQPMGASALTLDEAINIAVSNHPSTQAARALYKSSVEDAEALRAGFRPQVTLDSSATWVRGNTSTTRSRHSSETVESKDGWAENVQYANALTLSKVLWDGGRTEGNVTAAEGNAAATLQQSYSTQYQVAQRASTAYIGVLRQREIVALLEEVLTRSEDYVSRTQARVDSGEAAASEITDTDVAVNGVKALLNTNLLALRTSEAQFLEAIGEMPGALERPAVPTDIDGLDIEELVLIAHEQNPLITAALATSQSRRASLAAAVPSYIPTVNMSVSAERNLDTGQFRVSSTDAGDEEAILKAELSMSMSLYDGGAAISTRRKAASGVEEAAQREAEARRNAEQTLRLAHSTLVSAQEFQPEAQFTLDTAKKDFEDAQADFEVNGGSALPELGALVALYNAEILYLTNEWTIITAKYDVMAAMGRLLDIVGVE